MISFIVRYLKRFVVLLPGLAIAYVSIKTIFPSLEERLPFGVALLMTYILGAYVLIPAAIRLIRIVRPPMHPPTYSVTPDGFASDPINIGLIGSRTQLIEAMQAAGWSVADGHSPLNVFREIIAVLTGRMYKTAPMSYLYFLGRKQDIGFEIQISGSRGIRHHVRFWATRYDSNKPLPTRPSNRSIRRPDTSKPVLWLGAASKDVGFALIRHNVQISHMIHPDTDRERDLIINHLKSAERVNDLTTMRIREPYRLVNRVWRGYLESDGTVAIGRLR